MIYFPLLGIKNVSAELSCWFIRHGTLYFTRHAKKAEKFNSNQCIEFSIFKESQVQIHCILMECQWLVSWEVRAIIFFFYILCASWYVWKNHQTFFEALTGENRSIDRYVCMYVMWTLLSVLKLPVSGSWHFVDSWCCRLDLISKSSCHLLIGLSIAFEKGRVRRGGSLLDYTVERSKTGKVSFIGYYYVGVRKESTEVI